MLLKNNNSLLPLDRTRVHSIAIIGEHADTSMISGGGSAQVDPPGQPPSPWQAHVWFPTSPLKAISSKLAGGNVQFDSGADPQKAAELAKQADVAIVFVTQWESEGMDLPNLSLPNKQDALIEAVAQANPRTIVVLETGTAVTMPWIDRVPGVLEAWYAGSKGADAVANILFGDVNPDAKLPMTFPRSESDLPHPKLVTPPPNAGGVDPVANKIPSKPTFDVNYDEGLQVGYKWYDQQNKPVLFPFGHGLSYTTYSYSDLKVSDGAHPVVSFTLTNTGQRAGAEVAQVYAALPANAGEAPKRLVGWSKVALKPGERRQVSVDVDPKYLSVFDEQQNQWKLPNGEFSILVGSSSRDLPLKQTLQMR